MQAMATESFIFTIQVDIAQYFGFRAPNMKKRKKKQKKNRDLTKIKLSICLTLDIVEFTFRR